MKHVHYTCAVAIKTATMAVLIQPVPKYHNNIRAMASRSRMWPRCRMKNRGWVLKHPSASRRSRRARKSSTRAPWEKSKVKWQQIPSSMAMLTLRREWQLHLNAGENRLSWPEFLMREYTVVESLRRGVKAKLEYVTRFFGQRLIWAVQCFLCFNVTLKSTSCYLGVWKVDLLPDSHSVMWRSWSRAHKIHIAAFWNQTHCAAQYWNWERLLNCNTIPQFWI